MGPIEYYCRSRKKVLSLFLALTCLTLVSCKASNFNKRSTQSGATAADVKSEPKKKEPSANLKIKLLNDEEAMDFFRSKCSSCHGTDSKGKLGAYYSQWPMKESELSRDAFDLSLYSPIVYQALKNKLAAADDDKPKPMPPSEAALTKDQKVELQNILGWFHVNLPLVVSEAEQLYGGSSIDLLDVNLTFSCEEPVKLRAFLKRWSLAAFDRSPNEVEFSLFLSDELDKPVSRAQREKLVNHLFEAGKGLEEFNDIGLAKIAAVIGGAPAIQGSDKLNAAVRTDLKSEFFQLLKSQFDSWRYEEFFISNTIMVSSNTAEFYGCEFQENGADWQTCEMSAPRSGFFTTMGFLSSKRSSYFIENNNYGRVALIYFTLGGQGLAAAVNGPKGEGKVAPLPDCLESKDSRTLNGAARGTASIPLAGDICQSCHISRNLAAGSVLFRPFSMDGLVITSGADNLPVESFFENLDLETWEYTNDLAEQKPVDVEFLKSLLVDPVKSCSINPVTDKQTNHKNVNDLAKYLMANKKLLLRGFMRHAQRAYLNSQSLNFELVYQAIKQAEKGDMKLPDLLKIYFMSESFSCGVK